MNKFAQTDRQGRLETSLGQNALVLLRMDGSEEMSGDFEWRVEALSTRPDLDLHSMLGTHATVEIDHATGTRAFDGIVCEVQARGPSENGHRYDLVLRPWLHVASLRRNMRIFHDKTVVQIVEDVLAAYAHLGTPHLDNQLMGDYPTLEYTVQYGESDAEFVRRQLERHGISWSWTHNPGNHALLLTDAEVSLPEVPGGSRPFFGVEGYHRHKEEHFRDWSAGERITTGAVRLTDYNFKTPYAAQEVERLGDATHPSGDVESYDWPGDYLDSGEGDGVVMTRAEAERGQAPRHHAIGDVVSLGAGWRVTLGGDDVPSATGRTFICLKATHRFRAQAYGSGDSGADETPYDGAYVLMPDDTPYRPERRTNGPKVQGPETAVVVGEGEIDCDEHGRILVKFHWDNASAHTMRVRVSQNWASKGWGGMIIPRIGMEVIVEHLRGDPDKPIVTGCVYNGANKPPYELPAHKTKSVFRTDTHEGQGFNEISFEDQKGIEKIFMHAQRDLAVKVENHATERVDRNKIVSVGGARINETLLSSSENVGHNMTFNVGAGSAERVVAGNLARSTFGIAAAGYFIDDLAALSSGGGQFIVNASGSISMNADQSYFTDVTGTAVADIGGSYISTVGEDTRMATGGSNTDTTGKVKMIEAHEKLHLRCGASELIMEPNGTVTIKGVKLLVEEEELVKVNAARIDLN